MSRKGKYRTKTNLKKSTRHVLPLEEQPWSCFHAPHGTLLVSAIMWCPNHEGQFLVNLCVWDGDDTGRERWKEYENEQDAQEAYHRAVEEVSNAPCPLPYAWCDLKGMVSA